MPFIIYGANGIIDAQEIHARSSTVDVCILNTREELDAQLRWNVSIDASALFGTQILLGRSIDITFMAVRIWPGVGALVGVARSPVARRGIPSHVPIFSFWAPRFLFRVY